MVVVIFHLKKASGEGFSSLQPFDGFVDVNKNNFLQKRNANVREHTIIQTETQDTKPPKTQTGSKNPPEKVNF